MANSFITLPKKKPNLEFLALAEKAIDQFIPSWNYQIESKPGVTHFIGVSGGVDSSALVCALLVKHPNIDWHLFFADTGNEPSDVEQIIRVFAEEMGATVTIGKPEKSLFECIEDNGFLPSVKARWCTAVLKIKVWEEFISSLLADPEHRCINYAGVRYDERDRAGMLGIERVESAHPFVDQKVEREAVVKIAAALGVLGGTYYRGKSRSGCMNCFFQTKQELISLAVWDKKQFEKGASVEKLNTEILQLLDDSNHPIKALGYYSGYPISQLVINGKRSLNIESFFGESRMDKDGVNWDYLTGSLKTKRKVAKVDSKQQSMFEEVLAEESYSDKEITLYVAIEHLIHPLMHGNLGVYSQLPITFSTSVSGLTRSVNGYMYHRRTIADGFYVSELHYESQSHITVLCLRFPRTVLPKVDYNQPGVYTWSSDISYNEIAHTMRAIQRLGHFAYCKQMIEISHTHFIDGRTLNECRKYIDLVESTNVEIGELIGIGHFKPKEKMVDLRDDSYDESPKTVRCIACSL